MRLLPPARLSGPAALLSLAALIGCARPPAARPEAPPAPVTVSLAVKKTVPIQARAIGTVKVIATVSIRPRVAGELTGVHFTEGDFVKKGQMLFTIDPRPFDAAVKQAEATRAKDVALLKGAELELERIKKGGAGGVVAGADLDAAQTRVDSAKAAVEADDAAINSAKIQTGFTTITSPIDGRAGGLLVTGGNLVRANDPTPLVVINQISPIHVAFNLPEQQLPVVAAAMRKGPLKVEADLRGGGPLACGVLTFIDNAVDPTTGTVQMKAEFKNEDEALWPGQFVDAVLTIGERPDSVVIPTAALQTGQHGLYVYLVTAQKTAELRPVTVAFETGGEAVIASGLSGGESVVVEGQLRLAPKIKVEVKGQPGAGGTK
ncbi:MAG TPA: efflux RND transporter periplasmic adaptor subunit [Gemmataceae bacterium]|nr:efflux RND transporter periplasmic adaptor subunit [Gemmataceae bacterium]